MSNTNQFDWVPFYRKVADRLLDFKDDRTELVSKVKQIFKRAKLKLPTLEQDNAIVDIDPFTFFGLFNKTSMKPANRVSIITAVAEVLPVSPPIPVSFDSVPVLNPLNATFYYFIDERGEHDIDELWALFAFALRYADDPTAENKAEVSRLFDLAIGKKGNGNSKITMALYWIAPDTFLNLDSRNEWYIYQSGKIPASVVQSLPAVETKISAAKYFEIAEKLKAYLQSDGSRLKNFQELSFEAWVLSQKVNDAEKAQKAQAEKKTKGAAVADDNVETVHYWMFSPGDGAASWEEFYDAGIMAIGWDEIGDLSVFPSKDAMKQRMKECYDASKSYKNSAHATWQFVHDLKPGDIVFAKKGLHLIIGKGVVESDYEFNADRSHYKNVRKVKWTHKGEWAIPLKAL